jgi:hypothetical protein
MSMDVRCVVVTTDGKKYLTRWCADVIAAIRSAERFAERKSLDVKSIDGLVRHQQEET